LTPWSNSPTPLLLVWPRAPSPLSWNNTLRPYTTKICLLPLMLSKQNSSAVS
jgi:hypothetical protein